MGLEELYGKQRSTGFEFEVPQVPAAIGGTVKLTVKAPTTTSVDVLVLITLTGTA